MAELARDIDELTNNVTELAAIVAADRAAHAEYRADINRLYAAWPEHLRTGHGS